MNVLTSSVRIRKDSTMIVRSAPHVTPILRSAHPTVYGSAPHSRQTNCGLLTWPGHTSHHFSPTPLPALDITTDHAGLVLLGKCAQHLGLIERLQTIPLAQRSRTHTLQAKLLQF